MEQVNSKMCSICQDKIKVGKAGIAYITCCKHAFHSSCFDRWISSDNFNGCPDCRNDLTVKCDITEPEEITKNKNDERIQFFKPKYSRHVPRKQKQNLRYTNKALKKQSHKSR